MELIRGIHNLRPEHKGCVLTIGNFDGVHLGHQAVLRQVVQRARALGLPATVMTFEPLPLEFFAPTKAPARLSRLHEKLELLRGTGIDRVICVRFNRTFAELSAEQFVETLLCQQLGIRYLVVGDDFRFGRGRRGDFALLQSFGQSHGFDVVNTLSLLHGNERVSSTGIRQLLAAGELDKVEQRLGRPYAFSGRVAHGDKRGRQLGFPTANIYLGRLRVPVSGVFAVEVIHGSGPNRTCYKGVANIGNRPSVSGEEPRLEVHLFEFSGDLYGQRLQVVLRTKLRDEERFASLEALQQQIRKDAEQAQLALSQLDRLSFA